MLFALRTSLLTRGWLPLLLVAAHLVLASALGAYAAWPPLDVPMHLAGGAAAAWFLDGLVDRLEEAGRLEPSRGLLRLLLLFGLATVAAVAWELVESVVDRLSGATWQVGLRDTLKDLMTGPAGALGFLGARAAVRRGRR